MAASFSPATETRVGLLYVRRVCVSGPWRQTALCARQEGDHVAATPCAQSSPSWVEWRAHLGRHRPVSAETPAWALSWRHWALTRPRPWTRSPALRAAWTCRRQNTPTRRQSPWSTPSGRPSSEKKAQGIDKRAGWGSPALCMNSLVKHFQQQCSANSFCFSMHRTPS